MKITFVAAGSRGDVQPPLALAAGFQRKGYDVVFCTHSTFQEAVVQQGLNFAPLAGNPDKDLLSENGYQWIESDRNMIEFGKGLLRMVTPMLTQMLADTWKAAEKADVLIYNFLAAAAYHIAEKRKIPSFVLGLQPMSPTVEFPMFLFPSIPFGRFLNRLTYVASEPLFWLPIRSVFNNWRENTLGLPPLSFFGPLTMARKRRIPMLYGFSRHVVTRPSDWPSNLHLTGYWFLDHQKEPDARLHDFLNGEKPIYIGFGSMVERHPETLARIVEDAVEKSNVRAVVLSGWAGLGRYIESDNILVIDSAPHSWLFPRVAAIVHHGGAGTTAAALRSGVPGVVVPFFADQHFWADRVFKLGCAPKPTPRKMLTAEMLSMRIREAIERESIRQRASQVGTAIAQEQGITHAIEAVEQELRLA